MKPVPYDRIDQKAEYYFSDESNKKKVLDILFEKQPSLTAFAHFIYAESEDFEKQGKKYMFTVDEVDFSTDLLPFIIYAMLPQDRKIPEISVDTVEKYDKQTMDTLKKISDQDSPSIKKKEKEFDGGRQKDMIYFVMNEMLSAYDDKEIGDKFHGVFLYYALTLILCIDGEIE